LFTADGIIRWVMTEAVTASDAAAVVNASGSR
jgi:hypothetical protein